MNDDWRLQHLFDKDSIRPVHFWSRIRPARRPGTKGPSYWIRKVDYDKNVVIPPLNLRDRAIVLRNLWLCFSGRYWADKAPTYCWTAFTCCIEHTQPITVGHLLLSWANNKKNDFPGEPEFDQVQSLIQLWCHEGPRDAFLCPTYSAVDEDVSKGALLACWLAS